MHRLASDTRAPDPAPSAPPVLTVAPAAPGDASRAEAPEGLLQTLLDSVSEGVVLYDRELRYRVWNRFMEKMTGLAAEEVVGKAALEIFPHLRAHGVEILLRRALGGETVRSTDTPYLVPSTGRTGWVVGEYAPHRAADGSVQGVVAILHDVTEQRRAEEELRHAALHDLLTGLPNRDLFMERLARAILRSREREGHPFAVLFLDLDRFKVVNDGLGHQVGDELLAAVARRIRECIRPGDTVARFGGDEFAVLLEELGGAEDATRVAERIQGAIASPVNLSGYEVYTSASIGIALSSSAYGRPEYLLRNADTAMYRAKERGMARHEFFDPGMHAQALVRLQQETDLRHAVERGELRVFYQPVVGLAGGRVEGVEALARWEHPVRGWIPPLDFIPTAEETGMIHPVGRWVLEEACRRLREWREGGRELSVSVNLSVREFAQPDLVERVEQTLRETGADPRGLVLEVTESVIAENLDSAAATLERLRALGIRVYLDDFGTGYSSLSVLHRLPLDALKVDRSFVGRVGAGSEAAPLVRTIATLARSLGLATVAEGVETPEQLAFLREVGCGHAQGYLFSPPVEAEDLRALLEADPRW